MLKPSLFYAKDPGVIYPPQVRSITQHAGVLARDIMRWQMERGDRWQSIPLLEINRLHETKGGRKLTLDEQKEFSRWCIRPFLAMRFSEAWLEIGLHAMLATLGDVGDRRKQAGLLESWQAFKEFREQKLNLVEVAEIARVALNRPGTAAFVEDVMDLSISEVDRIKTGLHYFCGPDHGRKFR